MRAASALLPTLGLEAPCRPGVTSARPSHVLALRSDMHTVLAAVIALALVAELGCPGTEARERAPGLLWARTLKSRLRQVRFSFDGKYVLAQDDSEVVV